MCCGGQINCRAPLRQQGREAADMVGMFVGNDDAVEPFGGLLVDRQAAQRFALAEARIHQQTRLRRLDQRSVARAARSQNTYAQADAVPPIRRRRKNAGRMHNRKASRRRQSFAASPSKKFAPLETQPCPRCGPRFFFSCSPSGLSRRFGSGLSLKFVIPRGCDFFDFLRKVMLKTIALHAKESPFRNLVTPSEQSEESLILCEVGSALR